MSKDEEAIVQQIQEVLQKASIVRIVDTTKGMIELLVDGAWHRYGGSYENRLSMMAHLRDLSAGGVVKVYVGAKGEEKLSMLNVPETPKIEPGTGFGKPNR